MARICTENRIEIRSLKGKVKRILQLGTTYPTMSSERRMKAAVRMNEMVERIKYLRMNRLNSQSPEWDFTLVLKKDRVKNRKL